MKSSGDQSQQFNTTLILAMIVAAILAFCLLGIIYGCMKANNAPKAKPPTAQSELLPTSWPAVPHSQSWV
jgi:heme/copper-type cytochrome/quinol oxidase subunit 2